ncbi:hypothetical protein [Streptomyces brasiliscabiei]|uniref:hypothetical protein n=1 Tax=Streptomyces brasiliscabiei TaxID=2736302 RepID=UPI001C11E5AD|nr:hypothetical protein [Streptomyces brasiliscabiei]
MSPQSQHTAMARASYLFQDCKLARRHIERIWAVMCEGFPDSAGRVMGTRRGILVEIYASTLDDLIQGLIESNEPGDPEIIDNLWLSISTVSEGVSHEFPKSIRIEIDQKGLMLSISGDPAWARSKVDHLKTLIQDTHGKRRLWLLSPEFTGGLFAAISWLVYALAMTAAGVGPTSKGDQSLWTLLPLAICPTFAYFIGNIAGRRVERRHQTTLWISESTPPPQPPTMSRFERVTIVISIASLIVAIVFGYLAYDKDARDADRREKSHPILVIAARNSSSSSKNISMAGTLLCPALDFDRPAQCAGVRHSQATPKPLSERPQTPRVEVAILVDAVDAEGRCVTDQHGLQVQERLASHPHARAKLDFVQEVIHIRQLAELSGPPCGLPRLCHRATLVEAVTAGGRRGAA